MIRNKQLDAFCLPGSDRQRNWRVADPGWGSAPVKRSTKPDVEDISILTSGEVGAILGITSRAVRMAAAADKIDFKWLGDQRRYSVGAVRRFLAERQTKSMPRNRRAISKSVVAWAKKKLGD